MIWFVKVVVVVLMRCRVGLVSCCVKSVWFGSVLCLRLWFGVLIVMLNVGVGFEFVYLIC